MRYSAIVVARLNRLPECDLGRAADGVLSHRLDLYLVALRLGSEALAGSNRLVGQRSPGRRAQGAECSSPDAHRGLRRRSPGDHANGRAHPGSRRLPPGSVKASTSRRDVHAVAEYVAILHHDIADIDADTQKHAIRVRKGEVGARTELAEWRSRRNRPRPRWGTRRERCHPPFRKSAHVQRQ